MITFTFRINTGILNVHTKCTNVPWNQSPYPMYFHRALTWSSDVSDGVGVTDMATAAVGISEGFVLYHKVVFCFSLSVLLLWFRAGFCKFKCSSGFLSWERVHLKDTCLRSNFNWLLLKRFLSTRFMVENLTQFPDKTILISKFSKCLPGDPEWR